jgi:cell wall-associated NlpC family hydrolase
VFFADTNGPGITHVGMYAGDGVMLNAPNEHDTVRLMALDDPYWQQHLVGFGRPTD